MEHRKYVSPVENTLQCFHYSLYLTDKKRLGPNQACSGREDRGKCPLIGKSLEQIERKTRGK
jgi:hypothetical protein